LAAEKKISLIYAGSFEENNFQSCRESVTSGATKKAQDQNDADNGQVGLQGFSPF